MEQAMIFRMQPLQARKSVKAHKNVLWNTWKWIKWISGGVVTAMFVPSKADQQIEEGRARVRELMARSY